MSIVVAGIFLIAVLMATAFPLATGLLGLGVGQGEALSQSAQAHEKRLRTNITLIDVSSPAAPPDTTSTTINVQAENNGSVAIVNRILMDVFVDYEATNGQFITTRLTYIDTASLGNNEWTVTSISPDVFNPTIWNPGEQATFQLKVSPAVKNGSTATVAVVTPNGVDASRSYVQ